MKTKETARALEIQRALNNIEFQKSLIAEMWSIRNNYSSKIVILNAIKSIKISSKILK